MKLLRILIVLHALLGINLLVEPVWGQQNVIDDFEEGDDVEVDFEEEGPPNEPPYVEDDTNEFESTTPPELDPTPPARPVVKKSSDVNSAQDKESRAYNVPSQPMTQRGRETGVEKIPHPMSAKGLLKIEKDGSYFYEAEKIKPQNQGFLFKIGQINPAPQIESPTGVTYESMYGTENPIQIIGEFEWYPFTGYGKLGVQAGVGFFTSTGNGRFADDHTEAREVYTFYGIPLNVGVVYRLEGNSNWWIAPYIAGGGSYYVLAEKRDDDKPWKFVGTPAAYGAGGLLINLSNIDRETAFTLASEYGIYNMWFSAEYRYVHATSADLDVSANIFSGGIVLDF